MRNIPTRFLFFCLNPLKNLYYLFTFLSVHLKEVSYQSNYNGPHPKGGFGWRVQTAGCRLGLQVIVSPQLKHYPNPVLMLTSGVSKTFEVDARMGQSM